MEPKARVLVADDDENIVEVLSDRLASLGLLVLTAFDGEEAIQKVYEENPSVVLLDLQMPKLGGLDVLRAMRSQKIDTTVIIITAHATVEKAVEAMKEGAYDFITKPLDLKRVEITLEKAVEREELRRDNEFLLGEVAQAARREFLPGKSKAMQAVMETVRKVADSQTTVLLLGESGTGKEVIARAIHSIGPRKSKPFVAVNCVSLSDELLESELFGHEKGAFTGAHRLKYGKFEVARGGTILLDEVGHIKPALQTRLLRVLQEGEFERVGGTRSIKSEVRVIAATNRDLKTAMEHGEFREDLYYRLNVVTIKLPPLRDRKEDIPNLANFFLTRFAGETKREFNAISAEAMQTLMRYDWPGNVRELENVIERSVVLGSGPEVTLDDLPQQLLEIEPAEKIEGAGSFHQSVREYKRKVISAALSQCSSNQTAAAELLGLQRTYLCRLIKNLNVE